MSSQPCALYPLVVLDVLRYVLRYNVEANPRFFRKDEKALAKAQRKLAKHKRGSKERRKAKKVARRIHERISNRRHDFVHQTARKLVNKFGLIVVEKLNIKNMQGSHCLAKSIADAPCPIGYARWTPGECSAVY